MPQCCASRRSYVRGAVQQICRWLGWSNEVELAQSAARRLCKSGSQGQQLQPDSGIGAAVMMFGDRLGLMFALRVALTVERLALAMADAVTRAGHFARADRGSLGADY